MAYEWEKVELYGANNDGQPRRFTITDGVAVSKGAVLALTDPRTVSIPLLTTTMFAGVASVEKTANNGETTIAAWTQGVFDVTASAAIAVGQSFTGTGANGWQNCIIPTTTYTSGAGIIGYALETGAALEKINVRLDL